MGSQPNTLVTMTMYMLSQAPVLIVWLVGLILALKNWSHYPKVSMFASVGFATLILEAFFFSGVTLILPQYLSQSGSSTSNISFYFSVLGVIRSLFSALSWSLIVVAIFTQRYK